MVETKRTHELGRTHPHISTVPVTASKLVCFVTWRESAKIRVPKLPSLPHHERSVFYKDIPNDQ
jgi:hypothetical protein